MEFKVAIKNVVFDLGGVLIDWNPRHFYKDYFKDDEKMEYFLNNIATPEWNAQMDRGRTFDECTKELAAQYPEYADAIFHYKDDWHSMLNGELPLGIEILNAVKKSGNYVMYALTNWSAETFPYAFEHFKFLQDFEGIVVSGEEKMNKPEKGIFLTLFERYHLKPEECLFMDDNIHNVETAKSRGMHAFLYTGTKECQTQILNALKLKL